MIILIAGASHTGKTAYAQKLLGRESCRCITLNLPYILFDGEYNL